MLRIFSKKFLYFPGCFTSSVTPEIVDNYKQILDSLNIDYFMLNDVGCCGAVAYNNGYGKDFDDLKDSNDKVIKGYGVKNIVTNSGNCMRTFILNYGFSVQHISQILVKYINKLPIKFEEEISIYDSPTLNVYEEPRKILDGLGFDVIDLEKNRDDSVLCGCEGGMIQNVPGLSNKMSKNVFDMCKTKKLVVVDPLSYYHLKNNAPKGIKVFELSEVIV